MAKTKEKVVQIIKDSVYYVALTNKGNLWCGDLFLRGIDGGKEPDRVYWNKIEQVKS